MYFVIIFCPLLGRLLVCWEVPLLPIHDQAVGGRGVQGGGGGGAGAGGGGAGGRVWRCPAPKDQEGVEKILQDVEEEEEEDAESDCNVTLNAVEDEVLVEGDEDDD